MPSAPLAWPEMGRAFLDHQSGRQARMAARDFLGKALYARIGEEFCALKDRLAEEKAHLSPLFPGVPEALESLRAAGWRQCIFTSGSGSRAARIMATHPRIEAPMDAVLHSGTYKNGKPAPDGLVAAGKAMELPAAAIVMIGDAEADASSAKAFGCPFGLYAAEGVKVDHIARDFVFDDYAELPALLRALYPDAKGAVYDLDGTLVDSVPMHEQSWVDAYADMKKKYAA